MFEDVKSSTSCRRSSRVSSCSLRVSWISLASSRRSDSVVDAGRDCNSVMRASVDLYEVCRDWRWLFKLRDIGIERKVCISRKEHGNLGGSRSVLDCGALRKHRKIHTRL